MAGWISRKGRQRTHGYEWGKGTMEQEGLNGVKDERAEQRSNYGKG